jgi:hypothetical protein
MRSRNCWLPARALTRASVEIAQMRCRFSVLALVPALAAAQGPPQTLAGAWFDGGGNEVSLSTKSFNYDRLKPGSRPMSDVAALFWDACLQVPIGTSAARSAIDARSSWGFRFFDADAGTSQGVRLDGWQADDVSVSSQSTAWPLAQCNVLAGRSTREDLSPVVSVLSGLLGEEPDKRYRARSADGRGIEGAAARWTVSGPSGFPRRVYVSSYSDLNGSFALHLGLTEARRK